MDFSKGGIVPGPQWTITLGWAGTCIRWHRLYSIDGGKPEHIISAAEIRVCDHSKVECQKELEEFQALALD